MSEVTRLIEAADQGDSRASVEMPPLTLQELRGMANAPRGCGCAGRTLFRETYLRLMDPQPGQGTDDEIPAIEAVAPAGSGVTVGR